MIFEYQNYNYCINCDWLQYSVKLAFPNDVELECPEGYRLEILPGNNIFRNRAILWRCSDSAKFLTLLWSPYSRKISSSIMTVQCANMLLYCGGIHESYRLLQEIVPCYFNSMGRIDICCDFVAGDAELKVLRGLWDGSIYVQGKSEGSTFWHSSNSDEGRFTHCMSWGSTSTEIKVKVYNKSREIGISAANPDGEKPWIVAEWKRAGFDVEKVWRCEFSMKSAGLLGWLDKLITLDDVCSHEWLSDVFLSLYNSRFICRKNMGLRKGHKNLDEKIRLIVLPTTEESTSERLRWKGSEKTPSATSEQITLLRRLMSVLELPAVSMNWDVFESVATSIMAACEGKGITSYFSHAYGKMPYDYLQEYAQSVGEGKFDVIPSPNMDI